jgi:protein-arginine kinase activator protein McsA
VAVTALSVERAEDIRPALRMLAESLQGLVRKRDFAGTATLRGALDVLPDGATDVKSPAGQVHVLPSESE